MSPPLEPDSLLEDTIPQLMEVDQQQQQSLSAGTATATAARPGVPVDGEGQEDVPSPGRLDDFDFEGSLDAITTAACPAADGNDTCSSPGREGEGEGEGKEESTADVAGAEEQEVR